MKISKRLRVIGDLVTDNSFILDIGCDHALLDIYVVSSKKNIKAIASDINEKPLEFAEKNIKKYNLNDSIKVVKADGLNSYEEGIDTVVMSGLGATTIINVLKSRQDLLINIDKLIISSNNDYYYLRKEICKLGYKIDKELIVIDKNKYYPIITFIKGKEKYNKMELKYGPVLLKEKSKEFLKYISKEKKKLEKINGSLNYKHLLKKQMLEQEIKYLSKI